MKPVTANQEIIQVALMRGCWSAAEASFSRRIRAICRDWTEGDTQKADRLWSCLLRGDTRKVPAELAFAVSPLIDMLQCLRERCEPIDTALRLAISADPAASGKGVLAEVPDGYVSTVEAAKLLGCEVNSINRDGIRRIAYARAILVVGQGRGRAHRYLLRQDIETVRRLLDEDAAERTARHMQFLARIAPKAPPDAIPLSEVARRLGMSAYSIRTRAERGSSILPPIHKIGAYWYAYESDLREFPAEPGRRRWILEKIDQLKAQGYLQTREAAERVGRTSGWLLKHGRREGIKPERFEHVALYAPDDLDRLVTLVSARHNERIEQNRVRKAAKMAARLAEKVARSISMMDRDAAQAAAREKRAKLLAIHAAAVAARQIPIGAIPIKDVLATIGMTAKRFGKIRTGLSSTPIPRYAKAGNGQLYCTPDDLAAFIADPQTNRMVVVADPEYQQREHERKVRDKRYARVKRRYGNAVHREVWM